MNIKRAAGLFGWLIFAVIAYSTLSPLDLRPRMGTFVHVERFGAFGLMGLLFAIAYPRRLLLVLGLVLATAIGFELLQVVSADRHARIGDLAIKLLGGACGVASGWVLIRNRSRLLQLLVQINQNSKYRG
ncbi:MULTISPECIES: VanZ family protein [Ensifer]|jgi:hypothetical protein|uniref:VanZ family protein n=1 Tax=Ensifer canadensis TaxID=555315 RepID=A0AAW4FMH4_9HYPH|nr:MULTISPECIES: VanZ family protein [Ensifer]AHK45556.1 hypothetical protein OV14_a0370 [Ensifer adhaerens OV14]MDP9631555.1 glycopeptide antibiotics resistance protein [Ensifer adhaerens]KQU72593.1 hypothetical protein ASD00_12940 [Ensifer sp. Root31]KQW33572.1 hypothetical protein ASD02_19240 [Ensifer sp. Root1252]KQW56831.1 hypothetical protein ASD03_16430 [Ensifer sp. Root127]